MDVQGCLETEKRSLRSYKLWIDFMSQFPVMLSTSFFPESFLSVSLW